MKLSERHEVVLKCLHACVLAKTLPEEFSSKHIMSRMAGLALKDVGSFDLKIALTDVISGNSLTVAKVGLYLQDKLAGIRMGPYRLDGRRTSAGDKRVTWKYFLNFWGEPPVVPEEVIPQTIRQAINQQEAEDKHDAAQQVRLEKAETREVREELKATAKEQKRAFENAGASPPPSEMHDFKSYRDPKADEPARPWKLGERHRDGVFSGTAQKPTWTQDGGRVWDYRYTPPEVLSQSQMDREVAYQQKLVTDALLRGDTTTPLSELIQQASVWVWNSGVAGGIHSRGMQVGSAIEMRTPQRIESPCHDACTEDYDLKFGRNRS